nr:reverse transcriptase domain-containing protein [Tanacetum cinerariifolium]
MTELSPFPCWHGPEERSSTGRKKKNEKLKELKELKARLNFKGYFGASRYSESKTVSAKEHEKRHRSRRSHSPRPSPSVFSRIRRERSRSPRQRSKEGGVFKRLGSRGKSVSARSDSYNQHSHSKYTEALSDSEDNEGGHWKSISKKKKSSREEDELSQPWVCEETNPFTPRICYFDFLKTRTPSHIKTCDGSEDPEDHLKIFQAAAKTERWAMPTWCHMFNSTLIGNGRGGGFKSRKKAFLPWKQHEGNQKQNFKKGGFRNQQKTERKQDRFSLLTKTPIENFALDEGKLKASPPMTTLVEKRNHAKFCEFHGEVGHNTDECMHLRKQIEEMLKAGKLSHLIKELQ